MTNEERNTALYQKMFAEQEKFRDWLKDQPPEEVLNHAYEYSIREDILMSLEYHDLSDAQAEALMKSPSPLADVFTWRQSGTVWNPGQICFWKNSAVRSEKRRCILILPAMLRNMGSWSSIGHPTRPTPPAKKLLKQQSGSITMITVWIVRRRHR